MKNRLLVNKDREEYYVLIEKLEEITWALDGSCNDIDCDKYMYKAILKKKYKPILKHSYSWEVYEYKGVHVHKQCKHKVHVPMDWQKMS